MDLPIAFYITTCLAILITGISKSGFGGGLGVMAVPVMSVFVAPQFAAAVLLPILFAMDVLIVVRFRKSWRRDIVWSLVPGALLGLALGAAFFEYLDADVVRLVIGVLALTFVGLYLLQRQQIAPQRTGRSPVVIALSALSGFASYIAHAGGPPVKGYLLAQNMPKSEFVGTNTVFFFLLNGLKTVAYSSAGALNWHSLQVSLTVAPILFLGLWIGGRLHGLVNQAVFVAIVYCFLCLTGLRLLGSSLLALWA
ncbi:MAG: sulfite exporter TauE/SafE family protein [Pseudomonadota bacterium]